MRGTRTAQLLVPAIVQGAAGIGLLLAFWLVLTCLPMLRDINFPLPFTLNELLTAVILTGVMAVLYRTATRLASRLDEAGVPVPRAGRIISLLAIALAILIVYHAYLPLISPYLGDYRWVFSVLCLGLFLAALAALGYTVYIGVGDISAALGGGARPVPAAGTPCEGCGKPTPPGARFCGSCGTPLAVDPPAAKAAEVPDPIPACAVCGARLKPGAKFCGKCGTAPGELPGEGEAAGGSSAATRGSEALCASCGAVLRPGARFCGKCGSGCAAVIKASQPD